jgi:PilZ domain-containing protein
MSERRRHPRTTLRTPVSATSGEVPLFVLDVSNGGLRVAHRSQLPTSGGICRVDVRSNGATIQLDCAVVHTSIRHANAAAEALFHSGLRIMTPNPALDALLKKGEQKD